MSGEKKKGGQNGSKQLVFPAKNESNGAVTSTRAEPRGFCTTFGSGVLRLRMAPAVVTDAGATF